MLLTFESYVLYYRYMSSSKDDSRSLDLFVISAGIVLFGIVCVVLYFKVYLPQQARTLQESQQHQR